MENVSTFLSFHITRSVESFIILTLAIYIPCAQIYFTHTVEEK